MHVASPNLAEAELQNLPIFPLDTVVLLPFVSMPLHIFEPRYRAMVGEALEQKGLIAMVQTLPGQFDGRGRPSVRPLASAGKIVKHERLPDGRYNILLQGVARIRIEQEHDVATEYRRVRAVQQPSRVEDAGMLRSLLDVGRTLTLAIRALDLAAGTQLGAILARDRFNDSGELVDRLAALLPPEHSLRGRLLEELVIERRLAMVVDRMGELLGQLQAGRAAAGAGPN